MSKSRYALHVEKWSNCQECQYHATRSHIVLARGKIPCDVLFLGEAPGVSEDVLGKPFIGPAGKLLDKIIRRSVPDTVSYAMTNLVACLPVNEGETKKSGEPDDDCISACKPRLEEFIDLANPRLVVCVGKLAREWTEPFYRHKVRIPLGAKRIDIRHPSAILRANVSMQGLEIQRCMVAIANAVQDMLDAIS